MCFIWVAERQPETQRLHRERSCMGELTPNHGMATELSSVPILIAEYRNLNSVEVQNHLKLLPIMEFIAIGRYDETYFCVHLGSA